MKRTFSLIALAALAVAASAQTLNVTCGNVTYQFPAAQTGDMTFDQGTTLTIMDKALAISDITAVTVNDTEVTDDAVSVTYEGTTAHVAIAGNVAKYITATVSGAHVSIVQSEDVADEITYTLSGASTDGEFYLEGQYKSTVELNGLTLTNVNPLWSGAAVHVQNGKRMNVKVITGTTNTLVDSPSGDHKGCLYVKGHAEFKQKGTLNVVGNVKHAIKAGEYIEIKNATINVTAAAGDGISCNQYFLMESGTVNISGTADDGIQCDLDGTESTGELTDHEDEDTGNMYITGGTITVNCDGIAAKGIKAEGDINIGGDVVINVTTTGDGEWDDSSLDTSAACGISADGNINITGGTTTLKATGSGGKGMKCDGILTIDDGVIDVTTTGGLYYNNGTTESLNYTGDTDKVDSDYYSSPKGIKAGVKTQTTSGYTYTGGIVINGGTITISCSGNNGEGIESKNTLDINGGTITVNTADDCINSAREMTISGGTITATASTNDALDSNANLYIKGGTVIACGAGGAECGIDAAEGYSLYITGGNVLGIGANNNAVSATTGSQCVLSTSANATAGAAVSVSSGSTTLASFTIPTTWSPTNGGQGGPGGWQAPGGPGGGPGGGGQGGNYNVLISCPGLTSGSSYTVTVGSTTYTAKAATSTSQQGGGWF